jgi:DNA recombination protein RmuC
MTTLIALIAGILLGAGIYHFILGRAKNSMKEAFTALSAEAMKGSTESILNLAETKLKEHMKLGEKSLDTKKQLIDQKLSEMNETLKSVSTNNVQISERLDSAGKVIGTLNANTADLKNALLNNRERGQWGERMAEDVLRLAGFVEGVNFEKQKKLDTEKGKPDFTFLMPRGLKLNMDVKFPFDHFYQMNEAKTDSEREMHKTKFISDVRKRIKEVNDRSYINPAEQTVDYVLLFIPNEQVYSFIQETDRSLIDDALKSKAILCSPLTLFAVLAVVRQAIDNFALETKSREILSLIGTFNQQWTNFKLALSDAREKLLKLHDHEVFSTRLNVLERPLKNIEKIRAEQGLPAGDIAVEAFEKIAEGNVKEKMGRTKKEQVEIA